MVKHGDLSLNLNTSNSVALAIFSSICMTLGEYTLGGVGDTLTTHTLYPLHLKEHRTVPTASTMDTPSTIVISPNLKVLIEPWDDQTHLSLEDVAGHTCRFSLQEWSWIQENKYTVTMFASRTADKKCNTYKVVGDSISFSVKKNVGNSTVTLSTQDKSTFSMSMHDWEGLTSRGKQISTALMKTAKMKFRYYRLQWFDEAGDIISTCPDIFLTYNQAIEKSGEYEDDLHAEVADRMVEGFNEDLDMFFNEYYEKIIVYMLNIYIDMRAEYHCIGCSYSHPSQRKHMNTGCLDDMEDKMERYGRTAWNEDITYDNIKRVTSRLFKHYMRQPLLMIPAKPPVERALSMMTSQDSFANNHNDPIIGLVKTALRKIIYGMKTP